MTPVFTNRVPPIVETFCFRKNRTCRFELASSRTASTTGVGECPHQTECDHTSGSIPFQWIYGTSIQVTLTEPSANIVVRSEQQYNKHERLRLSLRKHIYEVEESAAEDRPVRASTIGTSSAILNALQEAQRMGHVKDAQIFRPVLEELKKCSWLGLHPLRETLEELRAQINISNLDWNQFRWLVERHLCASLRCNPISETARFSRYLGFVDLRLHSSRSPVALAVLVPPRSIRHDPDAFVLQGEYGPVFGAHAFNGSVFTMHDPTRSGAKCAQACLIMALAALSDRESRILGSYTLSYLGKKKLSLPKRSQDSGCQRNEEGVVATFKVDGLNYWEIDAVLNHSACNTAASSIKIPRTQENDRLVARLIEAHVLARFPAIMLVEASRWWAIKRLEGHAVVVVGVRWKRTKGGNPPEISDLIVHDPGKAPFMTRSIEDCLEAAAGFDKDAFPDHQSGGVHIHFVTNTRIKRHAFECIMGLKDSEDQWDVDEWPKIMDGRLDYRIALVHRDDIIGQFFSSGEDLLTRRQKESADPTAKSVCVQRRMKQALGQVNRTWFWSVAAYRQGNLAVLWLFDPRRPRGSFSIKRGCLVPWQMRVIMSNGSIFSLH